MDKKIHTLLLLLCAGCGRFAYGDAVRTPIAPPVRSQPVASLPDLRGLTAAQTVEIQNDWNGYSDITPILRHYRLRLEGQKLIGNAHVAVGGYGAGGIRQQKTTRATIPTAAATKFLATLAKTPLQVGVYKPRIDRADDYPYIKLYVKNDRQEVTFISQSQTSDLLPWKVIIAERGTNREFISNSPLPTQAFQALKPYLAGADLDLIIQRRRQQKKK